MHYSETDTPLVSVWMITYNHEKYIAQAIEGVLMQKTNFKIKLVIGEDCSKDNTAQIIKEYVKKYPHIIKARFNQTNMGMIPNMIKTLNECTGKYIALCEGDDYWTDPYKLQKQVDFLEENSEYVLTGHNAKIIDEDGNLIKESKLPNCFKRDASSEELKKGFWVLTLSMCFRNVTKELPLNQFKVVNGDTVLISLLGNYGKFKYLEDIKPAVYREHINGIWSKQNIIFKTKASNTTFKKLYYYYKTKKDKDIATFYNNLYRTSLQNIFRIQISKGYIKPFLKTYHKIFFNLSHASIKWFIKTHIYIIWFFFKFLFRRSKNK